MKGLYYLYHRLLLHLEVQQLLTIILQTMSSSNNNNIATHVPILDGTNYREWESQMKGYLQSQGLWRVANGTVTCPADDLAVEQAKWDISDDMAQGALTLRISPNCHNHIGATSAETWTTLPAAYGQVGISRIYGDFKALVSFKLSGTQHPAAEMEHFNTSLQRLVANDIDLPNNIVGLMYLSSLPPRWDHVAAIYLQGKNDITEITSVGVHRAILAEFKRTKTSHRHHANAGISGLKRHSEHPRYKQGSAPTNQHKAEGNQPGPSNKKRTRHGSRKTKKDKKHAHFAERSPSPNPFTLAAPAILEQARPMIALQLSRATPKATVALFKPSGITYSKVVSTGLSSFTGAPAGPGPNTLQMEWERLQKQQICPTMQVLTNTARMKDPRLAKKEKPTLLKQMGLPTSNLESKGKRRESLTPRIEEISDREEFLYKGIDMTTAGPSEVVGSINIDNGNLKDHFEDWEMDNRYSSVFDDEYDPRQVHSTDHKIHTKGVSSQPTMYVACTSSKLRIGDVYNKVLTSVNKNSIVNCSVAATPTLSQSKAVVKLYLEPS